MRREPERSPRHRPPDRNLRDRPRQQQRSIASPPPGEPDSPVRAVVLHGESVRAFLAPVLHELERAAAELGSSLEVVPVESVLRRPGRGEGVNRLYLLPFDLPRGRFESPRDFLRVRFPGAEVVNDPVVHALCRDRIATATRLLGRNVAMPETLISDDPAEVEAFIREMEHVVLKDPLSSGGPDHLVVSVDEAGNLAGETAGRRYLLRLDPDGLRRRIDSGILCWPPPFYAQRLVADVGRDGVLHPAQALRAYVVEGRVAFWTESFRDRIRRPSDFVLSPSLGAQYRFLSEASEESRKLAVRAADVLGIHVGVVDLIRTAQDGPLVLKGGTDGMDAFIDRGFERLPEFRSPFDFDRAVVEVLTRPEIEPAARRLRSDSPSRTG